MNTVPSTAVVHLLLFCFFLHWLFYDDYEWGVGRMLQEAFVWPI